MPPAGAADQPLLGRRVVLEALRAGRPISRILLARSAGVRGPLGDIIAEARARRVVVQIVDRRRLDVLARGAVHQGVAGIVAAAPMVDVDALVLRARERGEPPFLIALDGVEDPHNLGAVIRTAEAAGAHGVIIPRRRAAGLTPAVARASAGAVAHLPVAAA